jgi:hypothetical protein
VEFINSHSLSTLITRVLLGALLLCLFRVTLNRAHGTVGTEYPMYTVVRIHYIEPEDRPLSALMAGGGWSLISACCCNFVVHFISEYCPEGPV